MRPRFPRIDGCYTQKMPLSIPAVQQALKQDGLDGWLLYDFHGSNPIAARLTGLDGVGKMATRRWYYLIPASGEPRGLVHAIEPHNLDRSARRQDAPTGANSWRPGCGTARRAQARGDGILARQRDSVHFARRCRNGRGRARARRRGRLVRRSGAAVRGGVVRRGARRRTAPPPSGCIGSRTARSTSFAERARGRQRGRPSTKSSRRWSSGFARRGWSPTTPPCVAAQENAGQPALPADRRSAPRHRPDEVVLLDLWGKLPKPGAVFADITWVGFTGRRCRTDMRGCSPRPGTAATPRSSSWRARRGTDASCAASKSIVRARDVIERAGFGAQFIHRTGHSLGPERARQRRPHGRLRDARRAPADSRHRLHDRTRHLHGRVRRADRDQHVRRRARGDGHRPAAEARSSRWRDRPLAAPLVTTGPSRHRTALTE